MSRLQFPCTSDTERDLEPVKSVWPFSSGAILMGHMMVMVAQVTGELETSTSAVDSSPGPLTPAMKIHRLSQGMSTEIEHKNDHHDSSSVEGQPTHHPPVIHHPHQLLLKPTLEEPPKSWFKNGSQNPSSQLQT
jgi:hypothetical protein